MLSIWSITTRFAAQWSTLAFFCWLCSERVHMAGLLSIDPVTAAGWVVGHQEGARTRPTWGLSSEEQQCDEEVKEGIERYWHRCTFRLTPTVYDVAAEAGFPRDCSEGIRSSNVARQDSAERSQVLTKILYQLQYKYLITFKRLSGGGVSGWDGTVEVANLMRTLTEPFSFRKAGWEFAVGPSEATFVRRYKQTLT